MRALRAFALVALAGAAACAGAPTDGDVPPRAPPPGAPSWLPGTAATPGDAGDVAPSPAATSPLFAATVPPSPLDDPRLSAARELVARGKRLDAARAVDALAGAAGRPGDATASDEVARLHLLSATLRRDGGDPSGALEAYARAAALSPLLAPAARVQIAAIHLAQGKPELALAAVREVAAADRTSDRWVLVEAEAEIRAGDAQRGAALLLGFVEVPKRPSGWAGPALRIASALVAKPGRERAEAAVKVARLLVANASGSVVGEAFALEKRALETLPRDARARLAGSPLAERIEGARAKLRSKDARAAVTLLDRMMKADVKRASPADACALHRLRGDALGEVKRKAEAADAYGLAIEACKGAADRAELLFAAAKASARAERAAEAEARYARVEIEAPSHRLADDARAARVQAACDRGDAATAESLAASAVATYPAGDVVHDAPFAYAQDRMVAGRWDAAKPVLEEAARSAARERSYARAGRFDYFLGRAREALGDRAGARATWADLAARRPATYYGALAHARLEEMERGAGKVALLAARKRGSGAPALPDPTPEELASAALRRAVELAVVGDAAAAEAEIAGKGALAGPPSPGLRWWLARLVAPTDPIRASSLLRGTSEVEAAPGEADFEAWLDAGPFGAALDAWRIAYPRPFAVEVAAASAESGVGEPLILSIMREESAFSPTALSRTGARGLLQLMPATARKMARPLALPADDDALQRPDVNTRLGARFLGQLRQRFPHEPLLAVPAYNAGPLAVERWCEERPALDFDLWVETIPYRETRLYTKRVLASLAAYDLLGPGPRGDVFFTSRRACVAPETKTPEDDPAPDPGNPEPSSTSP